MTSAVRVELAHIGELPGDTLRAARALMYEVFDDLTEDDWEHALGGLHAVAWLDDAVVAHASLVQRRLVHGGRALRTGYVEAVGVRAAHRRTGVGSAVMQPLEHVIARAYDLGALGATDEAVPFYRNRGWVQWRGALSALTPTGIVATPDERGAVYVLPAAAALDLDGELTCDCRAGDVW